MFGAGFLDTWADTKAHMDREHQTLEKTLHLDISNTWAYRGLNLPGGRRVK